MVSRQLVIRGRVQGVGFRDALCAEASKLRLAGWVRNRSDGSVEALVQGEPEAVDALVSWARRGPPLARVDAIAVASPGDETMAWAGFTRRPSA